MMKMKGQTTLKYNLQYISMTLTFEKSRWRSSYTVVA